MSCLTFEFYNISFSISSLVFIGYKCKEDNARREEEVIANERIPPAGEHVSIVGQKNLKRGGSPSETSRTTSAQNFTYSQRSSSSLFKGFMTNEELRSVHIDLTWLTKTQDQVFTNHLMSKPNQGCGPYPNANTLASEFGISWGLTLLVFMSLRWINIHKAS